MSCESRCEAKEEVIKVRFSGDIHRDKITQDGVLDEDYFAEVIKNDAHESTS